MKTDIDDLMQARKLDAILIVGPAQHNPPMYYMTGGGHMSMAMLIKKLSLEPLLFHQSMERDEAAMTGLKTIDLNKYQFEQLLKEAGGDFLRAVVRRYELMFIDAGLTAGRVAVSGMIDAGKSYAIFSKLQETLPGIEFVGELDDSLLLTAMATKEDYEIERIRQMGKITVEVVGQVADLLVSHSVRDELLVHGDGTPLTIGDVKRKINLWLAERGVENPEGTIFAIGRDAGVPHSSGNSSDTLRLGQTIIFDIFPCESGGGYFYDFTRTWCLGYASDEILSLYEDVFDVYQQIMAELTVNTPCKPYQDRTCELFESKGHPTVKSNPQTQEGYVHSLGHGLGLHVHERPWFGANATENDRLEPGVVVTIEPGLYYPERGMGVRLENTVWVRPDGEMEVLAPYPINLVLPLK